MRALIIDTVLALLATAVPLLAVLKARELWRRWFPRRGKTSAVFRGYGVPVPGREQVVVVGADRAMTRLCAFLLMASLCPPALARDLGQWDHSDPEIVQWYQNLMQPDNPAASCCGEADAYWADSFEVDGDQYVAIVTDPRPDEPLRRRHIDIGTRIVNSESQDQVERRQPDRPRHPVLEPWRLRLLLSAAWRSVNHEARSTSPFYH